MRRFTKRRFALRHSATSRRLLSLIAGMALTLLPGCQLPVVQFAGTSPSDALPRLDQICHYFVITSSGVSAADSVEVAARHQTAGIENISVSVESDSITSALAKAVTQIERGAPSLPEHAPRPFNWYAFALALDRLSAAHWYVRIEKNGDWTITAKRRAADELFSQTERFEGANPDELTAKVNQHMDGRSVVRN